MILNLRSHYKKFNMIGKVYLIGSKEWSVLHHLSIIMLSLLAFCFSALDWSSQQLTELTLT